MRGMLIVPVLAAGALLAAGCAENLLTPGPSEAAAQEAPAAEQRERERGPRFGLGPSRGLPPLARLLEQREALGLTAEQVVRLETLQAEVRSEGEALRARLRAERSDLSEEERVALRARLRAERSERPDLSEEERAALRAQVRERRAALRPLMRELREMRGETLTELREILTDEQEAKLREMRREQ